MSSKYKTNCGFRTKVDVCKFKPEDCTPDKCDMYEIEWKPKAVYKRFKSEREAVIGLTDKMRKMKRSGLHKAEPDKYKSIKKERNDKVVGMMKLSKAYMYIKRTKT